MKVYVASKFERVPQVREIQKRLQTDGHVIVADWTGHTAKGKTGEDLVTYFRECAEADEAGVREADAVVLLHDDNCRGGFTELGIALGAGKLCVVVGGRPAAPTKGPIFYFHRRVQHFDTAEAAARWLKWAGERFMDEPPKIAAPASVEDIT
jgi:hypothetical protein